MCFPTSITQTTPPDQRVAYSQQREQQTTPDYSLSQTAKLLSYTMCSGDGTRTTASKAQRAKSDPSNSPQTCKPSPSTRPLRTDLIFTATRPAPPPARTRPGSQRYDPPLRLRAPPTLYLSSLTAASPAPHTSTTTAATIYTAPLLTDTPASTTPVTTAPFHPTRPHTFLLGFSDGTVAAYHWPQPKPQPQPQS